jgi:cell division protein FtsL
MKKKTQKNTAKKSKTKTKPKKAISKFSYSMGKIILVILFVAVVALALYFILDGSLKLINKRHIYNEKSVDALVMAVEKNDYGKAVEIYEQLSEEDKISLHNNQSFLTAVDNRFSDVLAYDYNNGKNDYKEENAYKFVKYFCSFLHPDTVRENVYYFFNTYKMYNSPPYENYRNFIGILNELLKDGNFEEQINLFQIIHILIRLHVIYTYIYLLPVQ